MQYFIRILLLLTILAWMQGLSAFEDCQKVYLATYPRCGNHWLRSLLEEATHIATGSVYRDTEPMHLAIPFSWGGYAAEHGCEGNCRYPESGDIVVIKTHYPAKPKSVFDLQPAIKVIRIVRHPVDSFYSHFLHSGHQLPKDGKIPSWFVQKSIGKWSKFEKYWNAQDDVWTICYEDLLSNIHLHFREILEVIGYQLSEEEINRAIDKFPPRGEVLKHLEDFHAEDLALISQKLGRLMKRYSYTMKD